jgi:spore maturation protein CgeB
VVGGAVRGRRFALAVAGASVSLGANALPAQDRDPSSSSNRLWKVLACGGAYLGQWVPGIEELARDGEHCRWYRDADGASDILRGLLADPAARREMARRGRQHVLAHHTYAHRLRTIFGEAADAQTRV